MAYIDFEVTQERFFAAKSLCYRAVTHVGTCKGQSSVVTDFEVDLRSLPHGTDLYMLPFSPRLRSQFSPQELRSWATLMTEVGIRVRQPFERFFSMHDEPSPQTLDALDPMAALDEAEGVDDLQFLRERKRLMPY